jgi:N-acetylglutamate synthase-like GNAT family acetyltransferase
MRRLLSSLDPAPPGASWRVRRASFEDVASLLRLIERAIEDGCARHYRPAQRRAVFLSYAQCLFVDVMGPAETYVAEVEGAMVGLAQLQPGQGRLSALFVDGAGQNQGYGRALLARIEARAVEMRLRRIHGAMSLNAVAFYTRAGYHACLGRRELVHNGVVVPVLPMEKFLEMI